MAYYFRRNLLPSRLVTRQAMFHQSQRFALRKSNPVLFQPSLSRFYTNSTLLSSPPNTPSDKSTSSSNPVADILVNLIVSGIASLITGDLVYAWYLGKHNEHRLNEAVEKGTRPGVEFSKDKLVSRPEIVERLRKVLQPDEDHSYYHVICGEHGTGKTTLVRKASREVGQGVIYVEIPSDPKDKNIELFGKAFGESLNFKFEEEHISYTAQFMKKILGDNGKVDEGPKWRRALEAFKSAGAVYRAKHNKPPVIVYDNISEIMNVDPEVLDALQNDAKMNADRREYVAVFVSSEGRVPQRMESRSAWSRAKKPVMEIGDLDKEKSMEYLVKKRSIKEEDAKKIYDLVGGRIVVLKTVADDFLKGQPFEEIKQSILDEVEKKFQTAQLLRKQLNHEVGKEAINVLLNAKEVGFITFMEFFDDYEQASKVLETNIFAYHPEKNTVSFQSQSIECYIREKKDIFIK